MQKEPAQGPSHAVCGVGYVETEQSGGRCGPRPRAGAPAGDHSEHAAGGGPANRRGDGRHGRGAGVDTQTPGDRGKTDRRDALRLAEWFRAGELRGSACPGRRPQRGETRYGLGTRRSRSARCLAGWELPTAKPVSEQAPAARSTVQHLRHANRVWPVWR